MQISTVASPRFIMFGNHDAWTCLTGDPRRPKYGWGNGSNFTRGRAAAVAEQMKLAGDRMLGWNHKPLVGHPLSIVGARPFSKACTRMHKDDRCHRTAWRPLLHRTVWRPSLSHRWLMRAAVESAPQGSNKGDTRIHPREQDFLRC
jgi:hypothetical protein